MRTNSGVATAPSGRSACMNGVIMAFVAVLFGLSVLFLIARIVQVNKRVSELEKHVRENMPTEQQITTIMRTELRSAVEQAAEQERTEAFREEDNTTQSEMLHHPNRFIPEQLHSPPHMRTMPIPMGVVTGPPPPFLDLIIQDLFNSSTSSPIHIVHPPTTNTGGAHIEEVEEQDQEDLIPTHQQQEQAEENSAPQPQDSAQSHPTQQQSSEIVAGAHTLDDEQQHITSTQAPNNNNDNNQDVSQALPQPSAVAPVDDLFHDNATTNTTTLPTQHTIRDAMAPVAAVVDALQCMSEEQLKEVIDNSDDSSLPNNNNNSNNTRDHDESKSPPRRTTQQSTTTATRSSSRKRK